MAEGIRPPERVLPREPVRVQPVRDQPNQPRRPPPRPKSGEEQPPDESEARQLDVEV